MSSAPAAEQPPRPGSAIRNEGIGLDLAIKAAFAQWGLPALERRVGWQPSRFLTDRAEAERVFQLAEQLGSINAAGGRLSSRPGSRKTN
jgi:hypothetical protein